MPSRNVVKELNHRSQTLIPQPPGQQLGIRPVARERIQMKERVPSL